MPILAPSLPKLSGMSLAFSDAHIGIMPASDGRAHGPSAARHAFPNAPEPEDDCQMRLPNAPASALHARASLQTVSCGGDGL